MSVDVASRPDLAAIGAAFRCAGRLVDGHPHGSGHINDTYAVVFEDAGRRTRYILQRINENVFRDVPALMDNIARVTAHVARRAQASGASDPHRRALSLLSASDGQPWLRDADGNCWRAYQFIGGARTYDVIDTPARAATAARAFGEFQELLVDLPGGRLHETIPFFHHTRRRFETLRRSIAADPHHRAAGVQAEIDFALAREPLVDVLLDLQARGAMPERVTHNDTKLNNVMIDDVTGEGLCVIDLDTVMPGLALYDFGDMVRSATNAAAEDERDLARVVAQRPIFEALVTGYLGAARKFLNEAELAHLAFSGRLITFEIGMRFLTDHLDGDVYFKIKRPGHNLDRARNQFALLRSQEAQQAEFERIVQRAAASDRNHS